MAWVGGLLNVRIRRLPGQRTIAAALRHGVDTARHKFHKAMHAHEGDSVSGSSTQRSERERHAG
ncbi:hypothetical protein FHR61_000908 [Xanthomonas arboricola]|uniref:Transposase n=1 Tax=Xanthomonas cannabis TaxID=1885674 RepID=A0ABR6JG19_9XANT|nr:hypothetical protein [Xanthomonas cannabis]MBB5521082.1 hypothetical protein [Xanthomonas cannabis]